MRQRIKLQTANNKITSTFQNYKSSDILAQQLKHNMVST